MQSAHNTRYVAFVDNSCTPFCSYKCKDFFEKGVNEMGFHESKRHPEWFREWQLTFYNRKPWRTLRNEVRKEKGMRCDACHQLITGKSIVDHIIEIDPTNYQDEAVTLNKANTQLLCFHCHNQKTFGDFQPELFEVSNERNVHLF